MSAFVTAPLSARPGTLNLLWEDFSAVAVAEDRPLEVT